MLRERERETGGRKGEEMTDSRMRGELQGESVKGPDGKEGPFILLDFLGLKIKDFFFTKFGRKTVTFKDSVTLLLKLAWR